MKDAELERLMKRAPMPERSTDYWEQFPKRVLARIDEFEKEQERDRAKAGQPDRRAGMPALAVLRAWALLLRLGRALPVLGLSLAVVCLAIGFTLGLWHGRRGATPNEGLAAARKYFREINALFPNQLQGIIFEGSDAQLVLADRPNVSTAQPLYVRVWGPSGCKAYVTFSGEQIVVGEEACEVLLDRQGGVMIIGQSLVWSSGAAGGRSARLLKGAGRAAGLYEIEGKPLETNL